jgi:exodeoxyribonuclease V alpha subunit
MDTLRGSLEHIIFHNDKNGYTVADFDVEGEMVTAVGCLAEPREGDYLKLTGYWTQHPTFGDQFKIETYALDRPTSGVGLIRYLSSGWLPGIGEKTARAIVDCFGDDTFDVLDNHIERILEVPGIGRKTARGIEKAYKVQREAREVLIALQDYGVSATYATKLYAAYGANTVSILLSDPYRMIKDVTGIGFHTADLIAARLGIAGSHPGRVAAGVVQCLRDCYTAGNTYLSRSELVTGSLRLLGSEVDEDTVTNQLEMLTLAGDIRLDSVGGEEAYYPDILYEAEDDLALAIVRLTDSAEDDLGIDPQEAIAAYQERIGILLDDSQREAITTVLCSGVVIITGGPGTGKTTIINGVMDILSRKGYAVALAAPTGRAAKRMSEATGEEAQTLHRLLEYEPTGDDGPLRFGRDEDNPLAADVVIVDEASMVDTLLMASLCRALKPGTRLILVGDADQLPSVGPGQVLLDLMDSRVAPVVRLRAIHRQAKGSAIAVAAQAINSGRMPEVPPDSDFVYQRCQSAATARDAILTLASQAGDSGEDIQIITPMKKGVLGTIALNEALQERLNPPSPEKNERRMGTVTFRTGDRVMQIRNNYRTAWWDERSGQEGEGVYNGDIGVITAIDKEAGTLTVHMQDDKRVVYDFDSLNELIHAWAMTVHKSQGSEFSLVAMPLIGGSPAFLTRKLLYTAITRAKQRLVLIGPWGNLARMVGSNADSRRKTGLKERIMTYQELGL